MARPRIVQDEGQAGFHWATSSGEPIALPDLVAIDEEPERLLPTHLEALDDALIIATGRLSDVLGGGRRPSGDEQRDLRELHRALDRLCHEYAVAAARTGTEPDVRAGQIIGTATLVSVLARQPIGLLGPAPLDGELDDPSIGIVGGFGDLVVADPERPWTGARWVVRTTDGRRLPATLSMLLHDSSGVNKEAAVEEHRAALRSTIAAADLPNADRMAAACALDWMLYDFLNAHRDGPDSGAIDLHGRGDDAALVVAASDASVRCRTDFDPLLVHL
ncbi:hypothetical protein [Nocardioides humi]|uniref:Uncharacterized protein n=1 Tax=Nocardioides humi TaxID=449461 RepID=A0ABN2A253_9ACTN|nr:hypothetical protein [Nocardioides humi]